MQVILWVVFGILIVGMLALDLGIFHRKAHVIRLREALAWTVVWVGLGLGFNAAVYFMLGPGKGGEFLTGYLVEYSLSIDNVFVWMLVFAYFAVPAGYQHRVLFYGIVGAMVMRGVFVAVGVTLLNMFGWVMYIFGAFLLFTGIKLALRRSSEEIHPERNPVLKVVRRLFPVTHDYHGHKFFVLKDGVRTATPLLLTLVVVEASDVLFAVDSVPAILAITKDPFIVWTSNVLAIMGLRSLFFLLGGVLGSFRYLQMGLAAVLCFLGIKMVISDFYHLSTPLSLGAIAGILAVTMLASVVVRRRETVTMAAETAVETERRSVPNDRAGQ